MLAAEKFSSPLQIVIVLLNLTTHRTNSAAGRACNPSSLTISNSLRMGSKWCSVSCYYGDFPEIEELPNSLRTRFDNTDVGPPSISCSPAVVAGIPIQCFFLGLAHRFSNPFRPISLAASDESLRFGLFFIMILAASCWICRSGISLLQWGHLILCTQANFISDANMLAVYCFHSSPSDVRCPARSCMESQPDEDRFIESEFRKITYPRGRTEIVLIMATGLIFSPSV
jgi:hypothetical protein